MRKIIHVDMDCFYAAVEIRDNPKLKGKPVAVGGSPQGRGVLTTASYEARKFGLRSAMPTKTAMRLCPDLILVPPNFSKYKHESRRVHEIFRQYTSVVEALSLDEAFLDVSECTQCNNVASDIAREIRAKIFAETGLTASAGIAPNKFLAKVASDWRKPNGQFTVAPHKIDEFVRRLKVEKIPGVGKVTAAKMHKLELFTCEDLQTWSAEQLRAHFGSWGPRLSELARGIDHRPVGNFGERKSLSVENTYARDLVSLEECLGKLPELFEDFIKRLDRSRASAQIRGLVVKLKFFDFKQTTIESARFKIATREAFEELLRAAWARERKNVRLIGLGARLGSATVSRQSSQNDLESASPAASDDGQLNLLISEN